MKKNLLIFSLLITISAPKLLAQEYSLSGWVALFYTQKFTKKWGVSVDAQSRSANNYAMWDHAYKSNPGTVNYDYVTTLLLRPSLNYYFANKMISVGYVYIATNSWATDSAKTFNPESRSWEQFSINTKIGKAAILQQRFRLEQRFLANTTAKQTPYFSQRLRYFARAVIPLKKTAVFTNGVFVGLQNEVFANVQNNHNVNYHLFDQNRAYVSLGFRMKKRADLEFGYLNQFVQQKTSTYFNHVIQAAIYTRF
ncbi:DUF2490 domain-containing protein [Mucilaginibacter phyllosphaerae]|uniref:DUF2490 domain-containing protein n=1 Tax=Mucilaginibacter phyllosphaerae TaxID=1812349 RepID=A0A4Y8AM11_9SPHI|nr:DUF2490 domain-containing protein [Mucilaginibacter phyllosphaerae]MBB3967561.1 hypothetical protein [Mucilaginibacter phyllosphaerae]TEW69379.1 DUF2490 domain-containing protein [Mucilaginibacter phyllosphaerae]GGH21416.1 hypothetical protein GCM10007352_34110 [Mucilaginibacter phyllosphaerae]